VRLGHEDVLPWSEAAHLSPDRLDRPDHRVAVRAREPRRILLDPLVAILPDLGPGADRRAARTA
jgi:hypothetical protein